MKSTTFVWIAFVFLTLSLAYRVIFHQEISLDDMFVWLVLDIAVFKIIREERKDKKEGREVINGYADKKFTEMISNDLKKVKKNAKR